MTNDPTQPPMPAPASEAGFIGLEARLKKVEEKLEKPEKDFWDKWQAISSIISGVLIAGIGFYATQVYDVRSRNAERAEKSRNVLATELQTIEKFFVHLSSKDETTKQAAIEAISSLGNTDLAAKMARVFGGAGARAAVANIASASQGDPKTKFTLETALADLFKGYKNSIVQISIHGGREPASRGTAFFVSKNGYLLTTATLFGEHHTARDKVIFLRSESVDLKGDGRADLITIEKGLQIALLRIGVTKGNVAEFKPLKVASVKSEVGQSATTIGFLPSSELAIAPGTIASIHSGINYDRLMLSTPLESGFGGAPVFNPAGEVIGIVLGGRESSPSIAVPTQFAGPLLTMAGVDL